MKRQDRDPGLERAERERFVVLLHVYSLTWRAAASALPVTRVADALALSREDTTSIVTLLLHHAYLQPVGGGGSVVVAPRGAEYIERLAGRRRSLRVGSGARRSGGG